MSQRGRNNSVKPSLKGASSIFREPQSQCHQSSCGGSQQRSSSPPNPEGWLFSQSLVIGHLTAILLMTETCQVFVSFLIFIFLPLILRLVWDFRLINREAVSLIESGICSAVAEANSGAFHAWVLRIRNHCHSWVQW